MCLVSPTSLGPFELLYSISVSSQLMCNVFHFVQLVSDPSLLVDHPPVGETPEELHIAGSRGIMTGRMCVLPAAAPCVSHSFG